MPRGQVSKKNTQTPQEKAKPSSRAVEKKAKPSSLQTAQKKTKPSSLETVQKKTKRSLQAPPSPAIANKDSKYPETFKVNAKNLVKLSADQLVTIGVPPGKVKGIPKKGWSDAAGRVVRLYDENGWPKQKFERHHRQAHNNDKVENSLQAINEEESNTKEAEVAQTEINVKVGVQNGEETGESNNSIKKRSSWFGRIFG